MRPSICTCGPSISAWAMLVWLTAGCFLPAAAQTSPPRKLDNAFFAFDNGTGRGQLTLAEQAQLLKDIGYAGIGYTGTRQIPEMLDELDRRDLTLFSIYVGVVLSPEGPQFHDHLQQAIGQLKGRETILWLTVRGTAPEAEGQAVTAVRQVADWAAGSDLRVALYPHAGFYVATVEDGLRLAEKVERPNVGATFNLCHWLKTAPEQDLEPLLDKVVPKLMLVSINGADREGGWERLIQPLGAGEYDVYSLLAALRRRGYTGPIGLQCYAVKGDIRENLRHSLAAWEQMVRRMDEEHKP